MENCINKDGSINFEQLNLLTEEQQKNVQANWTEQQFWEYFAKDGIMTHEEFCAELDKIINDIYDN